MSNEINKEMYTLVQYIPEFYAHRMNAVGTKIVKIMLVTKAVNDDTRCLVYEMNAPVSRRPVDNYKWNQRSNSGHVYGKMGDRNEHNCFILDSKNIFESIEDANKRINQIIIKNQFG